MGLLRRVQQNRASSFVGGRAADSDCSAVQENEEATIRIHRRRRC